METLILSGKIVETLLSVGEVVEAVERAFLEKGLGRVQMPPKPYIFYGKYGGDLRVMPAYLERLDQTGVKLVNVHPNNPSRHGLPTVMATIVLLDPATGYPIAIMDGTWITALRTGAAGAVAAKYLSREDSTVMGLIGAGVQAKTQLMATILVRGIERVLVYDIDKERSEVFCREMREKYPKLRLVSVESPRKASDGADILTTVTPSTQPIVKREWVRDGTHVNAIGADAPGKEELDPKILLDAKVVVDDREQASHSGEINVPLSKGVIDVSQIYAELGEIVAGKKVGRESNYEITVFDSTGLALQDVVTSSLVYKKAKEKGLGLSLELVKV